MERRGNVLYHHLINYYPWLDELRAAHPQLVIENCSSGGTRFDLGILATPIPWLSDRVAPCHPYNSRTEHRRIHAEICNHWMVGDKDNGKVS